MAKDAVRSEAKRRPQESGKPCELHRFVPNLNGTSFLRSRSRTILSTSTDPPRLHHCLAYRCVRTPAKAQILPVALASAHMRNPHYSITVAEVLDSPLGYLALMAVPVGLYFMFKILLWDYTVSQRFCRSKYASLLSTLSRARHISVIRSS